MNLGQPRHEVVNDTVPDLKAEGEHCLEGQDHLVVEHHVLLLPLRHKALPFKISHPAKATLDEKVQRSKSDLCWKVVTSPSPSC